MVWSLGSLRFGICVKTQAFYACSVRSLRSSDEYTLRHRPVHTCTSTPKSITVLHSCTIELKWGQCNEPWVSLFPLFCLPFSHLYSVVKPIESILISSLQWRDVQITNQRMRATISWIIAISFTFGHAENCWFIALWTVWGNLKKKQFFFVMSVSSEDLLRINTQVFFVCA